MNKCAQFICRISVLSTLILAATSTPMLSAKTTDKAATVAEIQAKKTWREAMRHAGVPGKGCFHAAYPSTKWEKFECVQTPVSLAAPRVQSTKSLIQSAAPYVQAAKPLVQSADVVSGSGLGAGSTFIAQAPDGQLIQAALGNFLQEQNLVSEEGVDVVLPDGSMSAGITGPNQYSMELNTNKVYTPACGVYDGCRVFEQFIFSTDAGFDFFPGNGFGSPGGELFAWLLNYGNRALNANEPNCPEGFDDRGQDPYGPGSDCAEGGFFLIPGSTATIADISTVEVYGITNVTTDDVNGNPFTADYIEISFQGEAYIQNDQFVLPTQIGAAWTQAEFNVLGNGDGAQAQFSPGTGFVGLLGLQYNSTDAPTCVLPTADPTPLGIANAPPNRESNNLSPLRVCDRWRTVPLHRVLGVELTSASVGVFAATNYAPKLRRMIRTLPSFL